MIRIDLQPRTTRFRWLGIVIGLTIGFGAFAGALYTLDQRMPLRQLWVRQADPAVAPVPVSDVDVKSLQAEPPQGAPPDLPGITDAVRLSTRLPALVAAGFELHSLSADGSGTFIFEGRLKQVPLLSLADRLGPHTADVRATRWFSGGGGDGDTPCRITGTVTAAATIAPQPVPIEQAPFLFRQVRALASGSGLKSVEVASLRVDPAGAGYDLHKLEVQGEATLMQVERLLQSLHELPLRVAQLDVVRSTNAGPTGYVTLSLDAFVGESPGRGI